MGKEKKGSDSVAPGAIFFLFLILNQFLYITVGMYSISYIIYKIYIF